MPATLVGQSASRPTGDVSPPKPPIELKPLPDHLKYAYLGDEQQFSVIIANNLHQEHEEKLLQVLKQHKKAIGWKLSDLPGINPSICMHRILMEEEARPIKQQQRRLNPTILEVQLGQSSASSTQEVRDDCDEKPKGGIGTNTGSKQLKLFTKATTTKVVMETKRYHQLVLDPTGQHDLGLALDPNETRFQTGLSKIKAASACFDPSLSELLLAFDCTLKSNLALVFLTESPSAFIRSWPLLSESYSAVNIVSTCIDNGFLVSTTWISMHVEYSGSSYLHTWLNKSRFSLMAQVSKVSDIILRVRKIILSPNSIECPVIKNGHPKIKIDAGMTLIEAPRSNMASAKASLLRKSGLEMAIGQTYLTKIRIVKPHMALDSNPAETAAFQIVDYRTADSTTASHTDNHLLFQHFLGGPTRFLAVWGTCQWDAPRKLSITLTSFTIRDGLAPLIPNCCVLLAILEIRCLAIADVMSINAPPLAASIMLQFIITRPSVSPECCLIPRISFLMVAILDARKNFSRNMCFISPSPLISPVASSWSKPREIPLSAYGGLHLEDHEIWATNVSNRILSHKFELVLVVDTRCIKVGTPHPAWPTPSHETCAT
ncbi:hypothetical protein CR513_36820, partial [Mucuna pruriens]